VCPGPGEECQIDGEKGIGDKEGTVLMRGQLQRGVGLKEKNLFR